MSKFGTLQLCYTSSLYIITKKYVGTMLTMRAVCSVMNIKMGEKLKKKTWINVKKNMQITGVWGGGSLNSLICMKMMWAISYGLHSHQISTPMNLCEILERLVRQCSPPPTSKQQNNKSGNIIWKSSLHPSCSVAGTCTISATKHWNCSESLWWSNCITHLYFVKTVI